MHQVTLAEIVKRAIHVGETRRLEELIPPNFASLAQYNREKAEIFLSQAIHEFAHNNYTKPF